MRVAGLMSGTSADGVDTAIVDIDNNGVSVVAFDTFSYPVLVRRIILEICGNESCTLGDICHLNFVLGELFAEAIIKLCKNSGIDIKTIDLIG